MPKDKAVVIYFGATQFAIKQDADGMVPLAMIQQAARQAGAGGEAMIRLEVHELDFEQREFPTTPPKERVMAANDCEQESEPPMRPGDLEQVLVPGESVSGPDFTGFGFDGFDVTTPPERQLALIRNRLAGQEGVRSKEFAPAMVAEFFRFHTRDKD